MKNLLLFFCCLILALIPYKPSYALEYFYDDFESNNLDKWEMGSSSVDGSWQVNNGILTGSISTNNWSKIFGKWNLDGLIGDYQITADVVNKSGVDQIFYVRVSEDKSTYYQIDYRYDEPAYTIDSNNITIYKFVNGSYSFIDAYPSDNNPRKFNIEQDVIHKVKIVLLGRNLKVYFDNVLVIDFTDDSSNPILYGGIGLLNWGGSCPVQVINNYDNIRVSSNDGPEPTGTMTPTLAPTLTPTIVPTPTLIPTLTATPIPTVAFTPTPPATAKRKIIVVPGLGASWNSRAMVYNETTPDLSWKMTPFVHVYDRLLDSLDKNGLKDGVDYYVWNYDWRRPVAEIVNNLDKFVNKNIKQNEKVVFVGHSLGGITSRIWASQHSSDLRLDKVISLAGPQLGALDAYPVWNGGQINNGGMSGIALNMLLGLQRNTKQTRLETIRNYAPVIKDLLPVFDYAKRNGNVVPFHELSVINEYLRSKNNQFSSFSNTIFVIGIGQETKEWVNLGKTSVFERRLGLWPDGKPRGYEHGIGDNTVLKKSAYLGGNYVELNSNHVDIVDKSVPEIMNILGLNKMAVNNFDIQSDNRQVYFIDPSVKFKVSCDNGKITESDAEGFVVMESHKNSKCRVLINGLKNDAYRLVIGKENYPDDWRYYENKIVAGQTDTLVVDGYNGVPISYENNDYFCKLIGYRVSRDKQKYNMNLYLNNIIDGSLRCDMSKVMKNVFDWRKNSKETIVTGEIIDYIREILISNNKKVNNNMVTIMWSKMLKEVKNLENLSDVYIKHGHTPTIYESVNYLKIIDLVDDGNKALIKNEYSVVLADLELINRLMLIFK